MDAMIELSLDDLELVTGGDAAATRMPGTNSWGQSTQTFGECMASAWAANSVSAIGSIGTCAIYKTHY